MCVTEHMWRSEGNLQQSVLSFNYVGPWGYTPVIRLGGKSLYWLKHLNSPGFCFSETDSHVAQVGIGLLK